MPRQRPTQLSDPYHDFSEKELETFLAVPDDKLESNHLHCLLDPILPAGTYEETAYFLPLAFQFLIDHGEPAGDLVGCVVGFASNYAQQLEADGSLGDVRDALRSMLRHWTREFVVRHVKRDAGQEGKWISDHFDFVNNSSLVAEAIDELIRFEKHADIAVNFIRSLADHKGDPTKAAWLLEYYRSQYHLWGLRVQHDGIRKILSDKTVLASAAEVVVAKLVDQEGSPTYWNETFDLLVI